MRREVRVQDPGWVKPGILELFKNVRCALYGPTSSLLPRRAMNSDNPLYGTGLFKADEPPLPGAGRGHRLQAPDLNGSGPIGKTLRNPLLGHLQIGKRGMA
jgi:hypothetical protein